MTAPIERTAKMLTLYKNGMTLAAIGTKFGVTRERVRQIVKTSGATMPHEAAARRHKEIAAELRKGMTTKAAVIKHNLSAKSIHKIASENGIKLARLPLDEIRRREALVAQVAAGKSARSVCGGNRTLENAILALCRKSGVTPRRDFSKREELVRRLHKQGFSWARITKAVSAKEGRRIASVYGWARRKTPDLFKSRKSRSRHRKPKRSNAT